MLQICPETDKREMLRYFRSCNFSQFNKTYVYVATDSKQFAAAGLFLADNISVTFDDYKGDIKDKHIFDGILRSGFNYALNNQIPFAKISKKVVDIASSLGYNDLECEQAFSINEFFEKAEIASKYILISIIIFV